VNDDIQLTDTQKQVIMGSLLGSMYIGIPKGGITPRIQFAHSMNELDYFSLKMSLLGSIITAKPTCNDNTMRVQSIAAQCLNPIYNLAMVIGKKKFNQQWIDEITEPVAIAMWFMDSASITNGGKQIAFSVGDADNDECVILKNWLEHKWGIETHIYFTPQTKTRAVRRTIVLTKIDSIVKLLATVQPYVVQSSQRKIDKLLPQYRGEPRPPTQKTTHTCEICESTFSTVGALGGHSNIHRSSDIELTDIQKQVILGSLLGDMWIYRNGHEGLNPEFGVKHSSKQKDYILWKYETLQNLARGEPKEFDGGGYGEGTRMLSFQSKSLPCLIPIFNATHRDGRKCITKEWLDMINHPIAIAVWFMDDGCSDSKYRFSFALGRSTMEECFALQSFMRDVWDIETTVYNHIGKVGQRDNIQRYLFVSKQNITKLQDLIKPYIIPSMMYKIR
jgi:hypothetical protein